MKLMRESNPNLVTLEIGKIGQTFPDGMSSAVLLNSASLVFSVISMGNLFKSLCFSNFLISSSVYSYLF